MINVITNCRDNCMVIKISKNNIFILIIDKYYNFVDKRILKFNNNVINFSLESFYDLTINLNKFLQMYYHTLFKVFIKEEKNTDISYMIIKSIILSKLIENEYYSIKEYDKCEIKEDIFLNKKYEISSNLEDNEELIKLFYELKFLINKID